jgi:hypothetical protein
MMTSLMVCGLQFVAQSGRMTPNEKKAEPPPTRDVNRDSGTASANGGWVRCWELHSGQFMSFTAILEADLAPESSFPSIPKR